MSDIKRFYKKQIPTGQKFGRWTVISRDFSKHKSFYLFAVCDCGTKKSVRAVCMFSGLSQSCGCLARELSSKHRKENARGSFAKKKGTMEYFKCTTWGNINKRTINGAWPQVEKNKSYFKKGIELRFSKDEYYSWCEQNRKIILMLYKKNLDPSIGRIDHESHYSLDNIKIQSLKANKKEARQRQLKKDTK